MTSPIAIKYPLDLTGINPNNLVINEPQTLLDNPNRAIVPNYGPYYTKGLIITDTATGQQLTRYTQYVCAQLIQDVSLETGLEVMGVIVITDPSVSDNILITYQVVGGDYSYSTDALIQMLDALQIDDRSVSWGQILGAPNQFPPTQHLHDIGDTYGWEYVVDALESVKQAILTGDQAAIDNMKAYIDAGVAAMNASVSGFNSVLSAHISNLNNPHQVTKAQVGLGSVQNYAVATQADVAAGTANNLYVTPYAMAGSTSGVSTALNAHLADFSNPHEVTAAQVGLGNVQNYGWASQADAIAGTSTTAYMNPQVTAAAIQSQAYTPLNNALNTHIANVSNPHQVTAAQVGLGNVLNYGMASVAQAQAGTVTTAYMNPSLTASAITTQALTPLNAHIANTSNPHQVTAAQVGAYTTAQVQSLLANYETTAALNSTLTGYQAKLGYTPVQQGTGVGQLNNAVKLGWSASGLKLTIDSTDEGRFAMINQFTANYSGNGYWKTPDGFIIQWGNLGISGGSTVTVYFPLAFPSTCLSLVISLGSSLTSSAGAVGADAQTNAYFLATNSNGGGTLGCHWIAVGH